MKKLIIVVTVLIMASFSSACVITPHPYYGGMGGYYDYGYNIPPQPGYWGYYNDPIIFADPYPGYGTVYDPFFGIWSAILSGITFGLISGGLHHHH
ncbi:MAG: hypothetical protein H6779_03180 [Candidatus Nomurabacteria bacterium]|nr:MAG: hypothetical protein H6779_03180 [Candidatus Nomurabacteria bacterium]